MALNILQHVLNNLQYLFEKEHAKYRELKEHIMMLEERKKVAFLLDINPAEVTCAHCDSHDVMRWGIVNDLQRYRCNTCNKTFNAFTNTPLAHLRRKGRWYLYAFCMTEGKTLQKSADFCGVHITTAFRWRHRFLEIPGQWNPFTLTGIIEADSIMLPWSFKGQAQLKTTLKHHPKNAYILSGRDRHHNTLHRVWSHFSQNSLKKTYLKVVTCDALFCTDNDDAFNKFTKTNKIQHATINRNEGIFINNAIVHLNNIMNYHADFLQWMNRFHGVASSYLKNYLAWFRMLEESGMQPQIQKILKSAQQLA